jgi:hypothetical protein
MSSGVELSLDFRHEFAEATVRFLRIVGFQASPDLGFANGVD